MIDMTTEFHIDVINKKNLTIRIISVPEYLFGESISSLTKYAALYFMTTSTYLYLRKSSLEMKELLIRPLKRDFNCSWELKYKAWKIQGFNRRNLGYCLGFQMLQQQNCSKSTFDLHHFKNKVSVYRLRSSVGMANLGIQYNNGISLSSSEDDIPCGSMYNLNQK